MNETPSTTAPATPASFRYTLAREPGSRVKLVVDVDADRVKAAADRVFGRRVRQANIPGFRPGKAPRAIYERTYGSEHLWHEAAEDVIDETYREIVQREDLHPLDQPEVELGEHGEGKPVAYTATMPVKPEVEFGDYAAHGQTVQPTAVTDEDVERTIAGMRDHHAELKPVERAAQKDDVVTVDIDAVLDGKAMPPLGRGAHLELGREYAIPGLSEGLIGASAGETKTLELTFPETADDDVKGKTGTFTVKVAQVSEKLLPALDDEFAKTVGTTDMGTLRNAVRNELAHSAFHQARDEAAEKLMDHLLASSTVEVPEILVHDELDHLMADLKSRLAEQGLTLEQFLLQARKTEDEIRADWREAAERRAKSLLVLDALSTKENVTISGTELAQELALMPLAQQDPQALRDPAVLASLARSMRNRKLVDKLIGLEGPDAEREAIKAAGGTGETGHEPADAAPSLVVPDAVTEPTGRLIVPDAKETSDATPEGREAIRGLLKG
ncbi:MAG: trigger factor [Chloroflexi bacterium]|nr:trigger factor [Chloroflexota bacterium]